MADVNMVLMATGWLAAILFFMLIAIARKDVITTLKLMIDKKKGAKEVIIVNKDRTVAVECHVPKDSTTIKRGNRTYSIDENTIYFDKNKGVQAVFIKEGEQFTYNPFESKLKSLDPQLIENLGYEMYYAGQKAAGTEFKTILYAAGAAAVLALIAAVLAYLNLSQIGQVLAEVGKVAAKTAIMMPTSVG